MISVTISVRNNEILLFEKQIPLYVVFGFPLLRTATDRNPINVLMWSSYRHFNWYHILHTFLSSINLNYIHLVPKNIYILPPCFALFLSVCLIFRWGRRNSWRYILYQLKYQSCNKQIKYKNKICATEQMNHENNTFYNWSI